MLEYKVGTIDGGDVGQGGEKQDGVVEFDLDKVGEVEPEPVEPEPIEPEPIEPEPVVPQPVEVEPLLPEPDGEDRIGLDNLGIVEGLVEGGDRVAHVESWSDSGPDGRTDKSVYGHHDEGLIDVLIDSDIEHEPHKWQGSVHVQASTQPSQPPSQQPTPTPSQPHSQAAQPSTPASQPHSEPSQQGIACGASTQSSVKTTVAPRAYA
ncbi:hypothetical protein DEO72_LG8g2945 [Vigna unguiculata]|uniref:Uncharacterized protein n=1 Tax=Vigna unguiculata TaxID=3917 RepID=A0A4D6MVY8_VIGUN|nr:hypothetical protein DEO72_LG8g2945 [Vigna unguiculata]